MRSLDIMTYWYILIVPQRTWYFSTVMVLFLTHKGGVAQFVARRTRNLEVVGSSPAKGSCCFLEQEVLPSRLSTG